MSKVTEAIDFFEKQIKPLMRGREPEFIGAVLTQAFAYFIAGHYQPDDAELTQQVRLNVAGQLIQGALDLVPIIHEEIIKPARLQ
jgi:hypothetical protein